MKHHRSAARVVVALTAFGVLPLACGGASQQQEAEQAALRHRIDVLEQKVDALSARDHVTPEKPLYTIRGRVFDTNGQPASGASVAVVVGYIKSEAHADGSGDFSLGVYSLGPAFFWAHKDGKSARLEGQLDPAKPVTLSLVPPGTIAGTFAAASGAGKVMGYTTPGRVSAVLRGLWGKEAVVTGNHFQFDAVPAGDVAIHLATEGPPTSSAHALVHVEPGQTTTVDVELRPSTSSVEGTVEDGATHQPASYEVFLLMPDGSPEAWYPVTGGEFGFVGRTAGDRVLLLVARGFKPRRLPVTLEANHETDLGDILLEPGGSPSGH
jgi:hypothetical protein